MPQVNKDSVFLLPRTKHHQTSLAYPNFTECALLTHVHRILQVRIPEWVAISFYRGSSRPRDLPHPVSCISCIGRWILYHCTTWEAHQLIALPKYIFSVA